MKDAHRIGARSAVLLFLSALAAGPVSATTIVVDFKDVPQGNTTAITGDVVGSFNYAAYGFTAGQLPTLENSIMAELNRDYHNIPTQATDARSPIPAGKELNINFVIGDIGTLPSNGDPNYYYAQLGTGISGPDVGGGTLGVAGVSAVRTQAGGTGSAANGATVCSIFADAIQTLGGLTPSNALTSANLTYSTYALEGTLAHELGHTFSLSHIDKANSVQLGGLPPLMGTGAIDLPNQDRIADREFSLSGFNSQAGGAQVFQIQQLVGAIGLRSVPEPTTGVLLMGAVITLGRRRRAVRSS